ncbi:hypothetical protein SCAR479_03694 [Seiridium cardinale]|uniref:Uncharacterized protein n=1 Tax=Seiridium cardinale TaxID=138064 RepID=A0ABR2Y0Q7_9PEZI
MDYAKRLLRKIDGYHNPKLRGAGRSYSNDGTQMQDIAVGPSALTRSLSTDSLYTPGNGNFSLPAKHDQPDLHLPLGITGSTFEGSVEALVPQPSISEQPHHLSSTNQHNTTSFRSEHHFQLPIPIPLDWKAEFFRDKWLWEIMSIVFSIACMMTVIAICSEIDDTTLSRWTFHLRPSTPISV